MYPVHVFYLNNVNGSFLPNLIFPKNFVFSQPDKAIPLVREMTSIK